MSGDVKKVVLAYSGGLDTSVILCRLQETYSCKVVTFTADLGQGEGNGARHMQFFLKTVLPGSPLSGF